MNRDQKAAVIDEVAGQIQEAEAIFAVDYRGLSVPQAAELRAKLRDADATFRVVKNSLTERAADKAGLEELKALLEGPTALTLVRGDAALAAKALNDANRVLHILEFKGGFLNGTSLSAEDIRSIARLPSRDVLNAQLVATVAAPLTGLARGLNALIAGIARQLQQIADQGLVSGTAEVAAPEPQPEPKAEAPIPEPEAEAPTPEPEAEAPEPDAEAPTPAPEADAPEPEAEAPTPAPEAEAPTPAPEAEAPAPEPEPGPSEAPAEPAAQSIDTHTEQDPASDAGASDD
jgi:large subunit ribosomal protein L10